MRIGAALAIGTALLGAAPARAQCPGDCDADGAVSINELIASVAIATGTRPLSSCPAVDTNRDGVVTVNEMIAAVGAALNGCAITRTPGVPTHTATRTGSATATAASPTPTTGATRTAVASATATAVQTPSATQSATRTVNATDTPSAVRTATATAATPPTHTPSATPTPRATATARPTATFTQSSAALACPTAPLSGCKQPVAVGSSPFVLKSKGGGGDHLAWKWLQGQATTIAEIGSPLNGTAYAFCVYDESGGAPAIVLGATIPAGPRWSVIKRGYKYHGGAGSAGGITDVVLQSGLAGQAKVTVTGTGRGLMLPRLPLNQDTHVIVQLRTMDGGSCWEARYSRPAKRADMHVFKDVSDAALPTPHGTATVSATASATRTPPPTATQTGTASTRTATATATRPADATATAVASETRTATASATAGAATHTPTATPTPTFTPTPAASAGPMCGNGVLEAGETCATCAADCSVHACTATTPLQTFRVDFAAPLGTSPSVVGALIGYRSDRVSLPNTGTSARVKLRPSGTAQLVNDLDYAVRIVLNASAGNSIPTGRLVTIDFDSCQGQAPVHAADFGCQIESCGSSNGPIDGCMCTVVVP